MAARKRQHGQKLRTWLANANRRARHAEARAERLQREVAGYQAEARFHAQQIEALKARNAILAEQNSELRAQGLRPTGDH